MIVSDDELKNIRKCLHYGPVSGCLIWKVNCAAGGQGDDATYVACRKGKPSILMVEVCGEKYDAPDVCWFLKTGFWPEFGVIMRDRSDDGVRNLKWRNLKKRRKPTYQKNERICVRAGFLRRVLESIDQGHLADEVLELLREERKNDG